MNTSEINFQNLNTTKNVRLQKLSYYSLLTSVIFYIILAFMFLTSCSKDDSPTTEEETIEQQDVLPTINLDSGLEDVTKGVIGAPGFGSLQHKVKATAPEGFSQLIIFKVVDGVKSEYQTIDTSHPNYVNGSNSFTYELGYIFSDEDVDKSLHFLAEIIDTKNNSESLKFAEASVKQPLNLIKTIFLETRIPLQPYNVGIAQFLKIDSEEVKGINLSTVVSDNVNQQVAAVFSLSEDLGLHLASPKMVISQETVLKIQNKAETKFKVIADDVDFDSFNIYNTFEIEDLITNATYSPNEQKTTQLSEGKVFAIITDDERMALCKITYFEQINGEVYLTMDLLIN